MQVTLELNNPSQSFLDSLTKLVTSAGGSISFIKNRQKVYKLEDTPSIKALEAKFAKLSKQEQDELI